MRTISTAYRGIVGARHAEAWRSEEGPDEAGEQFSHRLDGQGLRWMDVNAPGTLVGCRSIRSGQKGHDRIGDDGSTRERDR
jgi:hypothetical protein